MTLLKDRSIFAKNLFNLSQFLSAFFRHQFADGKLKENIQKNASFKLRCTLDIKF